MKSKRIVEIKKVVESIVENVNRNKYQYTYRNYDTFFGELLDMRNRRNREDLILMEKQFAKYGITFWSGKESVSHLMDFFKDEVITFKKTKNVSLIKKVVKKIKPEHIKNSMAENALLIYNEKLCNETIGNAIPENNSINDVEINGIKDKLKTKEVNIEDVKDLIKGKIKEQYKTLQEFYDSDFCKSIGKDIRRYMNNSSGVSLPLLNTLLKHFGLGTLERKFKVVRIVTYTLTDNNVK